MPDNEELAAQGAEGAAAEAAQKAKAAEAAQAGEGADTAGAEETPEQKDAREKAEAEAKEAHDRERAAFENPKVKKEFKKLHTKLTDMERRQIAAETEARVLRELQGKGKPGGAESGDSDSKALRAEFERGNPKPKEADYKTFEDFTEALTDWNYDRRKFIDSKTTEVKTHRETQGQEMARMQEAFSKQKDAGEAEFGEEFEDVVRGLEITDTMQVAILTAPEGHKVAYYLHQNPKEAERIADLSPFLQAKEIGKIESKIEAGTIQLKKTTKAPPPPKTLGGKGDSGPMKMTDDDFLNRHREEKIAKLLAGATRK